MSFILDALKKSENERQRQSGPALFEVKLAPPRSRFPVWAIGLLVLLAVNLLIVAWLLMRSPERTQAQATTTAHEGAPPPPATAVSGQSAPRPGPSATDAGAAAAHAAGAGIIPSRAPPLLEEPVLAGEAEAPAHATAGTKDMPDEPQTVPAKPAVGVPGIPGREELVARGASIPELRLDMHVYAARPADRFVFINMHRLREGEATADGLRVEQITPEGAVLSWQGKRFVLTKE